MSSTVTVEMLAQVKGLRPDTLRRFGAADVPAGVRIGYQTPSGHPGRARLRTALRGVDGSHWEDTELPVVAYWNPVVPQALDAQPWLLVAEGESDCWTAWAHGLAAVGLPGSGSVESLDGSHVVGAERVYMVAEPDNPRTYPDGVHRYVAKVATRLRTIGHQGEIRVLCPPPGLDDINAVYQHDPSDFVARLTALLRVAPRYEENE